LNNLASLTWGDFKALTKIRLAFSVVFSSLAGYLLAAYEIDAFEIYLLLAGGFFLVAASNIYNQVIEIQLDAKMKRTSNRPLPKGRVHPKTALFMAVTFTLLGAFHLYYLNGQTAFFGLLSTALYVLFYTPLKTKTPLAVFVGAIPGAIPFMLGWVAVTDDFGIETGTLFMIQFFWQFPHFWALGWMLDEDYKAGGFKMLPTLKKDQSTALQIIYYTFWTILSSIIPYFGFTGRLILSLPAVLCVLLLGLFMLYPALQLYRLQETIFARKLMLHSVIYITLIQVIYVIDALV
tara:strand:- start:4673 stop:5548 length:876 start_codon:yes stop_codon:yes gene_type:complete